MTSYRLAKTATITSAAVLLLAALLLYIAVPSSAAAQTSTASTTSASSTTTSAVSSSSNQTQTTSTTQQPPQNPWGAPPGGGRDGFDPPGWNGGHPGQLGQVRYQSRANVSVGQTITLTSTSGDYSVVGATDTNGTASGTITFTVSGNLAGGYTLSVTGGSIDIAGTTYTITSGSAQLNPAATVISGQGSTSQSGTFLLEASAHGNFVGTSGTVSLDLKAGATEYFVLLSAAVQG